MPTSRARLYDLADELHRLAPWRWMNESQLIVLRRAGSDVKAHISIMGGVGEHLSLALYLGDGAIHRFNLISEAEFEGINLDQKDMIRLILESRQLQVNFTNRGDLHPAELREIKALGRKYRGENWVCFRTFRPGYAPEPVQDDDEVEWLVAAMEQTLAVAPLLKENPDGDFRRNPDGTFTRLTRATGKDGNWETTWTRHDSRLYSFPEPAPSELLAAKVAGLPLSGLDIECQIQLVPSPVGKPGKSAVFPYIAISVDAASGFVFGVEILSVENQSHEDLIAALPDAFLKTWAKNDIRPASLRVGNETTRAILQKTAEALDIPLHRKDVLPEMEAALRSLMQVMSR